MASLVIELSPQEEQTAFNVKRWEELCADPQWQKWEGRIETDRHGHVMLNPLPEYGHGCFGYQIARLLDSLLKGGVVSTECPISTADGMRGADVVWVSKERRKKIQSRLCLAEAPEICVEVLSPSNRKREMAEKKTLYFLAEAAEVWFCNGKGRMTFFTNPNDSGSKRSSFCPAFPTKVEQE